MLTHRIIKALLEKLCREKEVVPRSISIETITITSIGEVTSTIVVGIQRVLAVVAAVIEEEEAITTMMRNTRGMYPTTGIEEGVVTNTKGVVQRPIGGHPAVEAHTTDETNTTSIMIGIRIEAGAEAALAEIEADIITVIIIGDLRAGVEAILGILTVVAITLHLCIQEDTLNSHFIPSMFNTQEYPL